MGKKAKAQAQAQEPEAPAITITDLAGMVSKFADNVSGQIAEMGTRLAWLEDAPAPKATSAPKAKATSKTAIPHNDVLGALKGICKPVAQSIVEAHYRKGREAMGAYVAKLAGFQTNPDSPSPRHAYAKALYATMGNSKVKVK